MEGAVYLEDSDYEEDELVLMNYISPTEVTATFITPADIGTYDVTVTDGLWTQKFVDGLTVLDPPDPEPGTVTVVSPESYQSFNAPNGTTDVTVTVSVEDVTLEGGGTQARRLGSASDALH